MNSRTINDNELAEWQQALDAVITFEGSDYAKTLLAKLTEYAQSQGIASDLSLNSSYINTINPHHEAKMPDDGRLLTQLTDMMRWNAIMMVVRAGHVSKELGGHIASYASIATLYEVGFQYFFHAPTDQHGGDLVYFQGHSSPGIYARAFMEGRLSEKQLDYFRQEVAGSGLSSYPHPWLMPDFWQFATVSMGLGPLMAIYQAQFLKYLEHRGLAKTQNRTVWAFCGDGEMGEVESLGALNIAGREQLDNLIFVINCNLQRLDGPVWGDGQVIQECERIYRGAGWNVIKVIWGDEWERLIAKDKTGLLIKRMSELVDGEYQSYSAKDGAYFRAHFFGKHPELLELVCDLSDEQLKQLKDGGHVPEKVYAAYSQAVNHQGQPTVILAKTIKGYGMGASGEAQNKTHQTKSMTIEDLKAFRDRFSLNLTDQQVENLSYIQPGKGSEAFHYLHQRRQQLGGFIPQRRQQSDHTLKIPPLSAFQALLDSSGKREISTTMAFVRLLSLMLRDKNIKDHIVPILADESRTFGMEGLFRQIGIYAPFGQGYTPEDKNQLMYYREDQKGQLLQQGISEAGAMASWLACATSYSTNNLPMIPFYIYYSMFGYQRFGDLAWASGDMRARGFVLGATAGRTTLAGEGLQHQDGHNILMFDMLPNCICYDPCFAYEVAVIIHQGLVRMYQNQEDVYYYLTLMNENYTHPAMPKGAEEGIIKGMYALERASKVNKKHVQLLGAGAILLEVIKASEILKTQFHVTANIWSVTSFTELARDLRSTQRQQRMHPEQKPRLSYVEQCLSDHYPVIAATDYVYAYADQIRSSLKSPYYILGTDGFGRSDTRAALRDYFEVDAKMIAYLALKALMDQGSLSSDALLKARDQLAIDPNHLEPVSH